MGRQHLVMVTSLPRCGSNMLCDLVSQVGYKNFGENVGETKRDPSVFRRKNPGRIFQDFMKYEKSIGKYTLNPRDKSIRHVLDKFGNVTICNHIRKDLIKRYISYELAEISGVFMYAGENAQKEDFKYTFPERFHVSKQEEIDKVKQKRMRLLENHTFVERVVKKAKGDVHCAISNRILLERNLRESFADVKTTVYEDIILDPSKVVGEIVGDEVDVKIKTIKQADEASRILYDMILESLNDDLIELCTGKWVDYLGKASDQTKDLWSIFD